MKTLILLLLVSFCTYMHLSAQYIVKVTDVKKEDRERVIANTLTLHISDSNTSWKKLAKIQITDIADEAEFKKVTLAYDPDKKPVNGTFGDAAKTATFDVSNVVEQAKGIFTLSYDGKVSGKFQFEIDQATAAADPKQTPGKTANADPDLFKDASNFIKDHNLLPKSRYDERSNVYRKGNTVIIYLDADGHLLGAGLPTTAVRNFKYAVRLIKRKSDQRFTYNLIQPAGSLTDVFNIQFPQAINPIPQTASPSGLTQPQAPGKELEVLQFAVIGPFEDDFKLSLMKTDVSNPDSTKDLINQTVKVAKLYYVSIQAGLVASFLKSPQNISKTSLPSGDSTLTADDPTTRGLFTVMAVFYPMGRSFLFPPTGSIFGPERFGIIVGTRLDKDQFTNFFGGVQFDFARGGSISLGAHYGRRSYIEGYRSFKFGRDVFNGNLDNRVRQEWNISPFIGVNIDVRILNFLFGAKPAS